MSASDPVNDPVSNPVSNSTTDGAGRSAKAVALITVIAALIAGIMIGVVADRAWLWRNRGWFAGRAMHAMTPRILARLDAELNLTSQQHAAVARILETHRQRMSSIMSGVRPQLRREIEQANTEISSQLTPEQRVRFDRMKLRMRQAAGRPLRAP